MAGSLVSCVSVPVVFFAYVIPAWGVVLPHGAKPPTAALTPQRPPSRPLPASQPPPRAPPSLAQPQRGATRPLAKPLRASSSEPHPPPDDRSGSRFNRDKKPPDGPQFRSLSHKVLDGIHKERTQEMKDFDPKAYRKSQQHLSSDEHRKMKDRFTKQGTRRYVHSEQRAVRARHYETQARKLGQEARNDEAYGAHYQSVANTHANNAYHARVKASNTSSPASAKYWDQNRKIGALGKAAQEESDAMMESAKLMRQRQDAHTGAANWHAKAGKMSEDLMLHYDDKASIHDQMGKNKDREAAAQRARKAKARED